MTQTLLHLVRRGVICWGVALMVVLTVSQAASASDPWLTFEGGDGPGKGKKIVFVTGDEEYRSEESMPMMAEILAKTHGFKTVVLFAIDRETGEINPDQTDNVPGLHHLRDADLMVLFLRWRNLPDEQTKEILDYTMTGKPIVAIRTATHPFHWRDGDETSYKRWGWKGGESGGGYGRDVIGETWVSHYGKHNHESTRMLPAYQKSEHPVARGVTDAWDPGDVYGILTDPKTIDPIFLGVILNGMQPDSPVRLDRELTPVLWYREYANDAGETNRVVATTLGTAEGFKSEGIRRAVANSVFWLVGLEVPDKADVAPLRPYEPLPSGFSGYRKGVMVDELR